MKLLKRRIILARITDEKIKEINIAYLQCRTYSGAAKMCGCAPSTVKKYIIPNFEIKAIEETSYNIIPMDVVNVPKLISPQAIYDATQITVQESEDLKVFWREIMI